MAGCAAEARSTPPRVRARRIRVTVERIVAGWGSGGVAAPPRLGSYGPETTLTVRSLLYVRAYALEGTLTVRLVALKSYLPMPASTAALAIVTAEPESIVYGAPAVMDGFGDVVPSCATVGAAILSEFRGSCFPRRT